MNGSTSHPFVHSAAKTLSKAMTHAKLRILEGQTLEVNPAVLVPVMVEFFKEYNKKGEGYTIYICK